MEVIQEKEQPKSNVIEAYFDKESITEIFTMIKYNGLERTRKHLLDQGLHISYVNAVLRKICREMGW